MINLVNKYINRLRKRCSFVSKVKNLRFIKQIRAVISSFKFRTYFSHVLTCPTGAASSVVSTRVPVPHNGENFIVFIDPDYLSCAR